MSTRRQPGPNIRAGGATGSASSVRLVFAAGHAMLLTVTNSTDSAIRSAAFDWLTEQVDLHGDVLPRDILAQGFEFRGERVTLIGPSGIWKPAVLELPISIASTPRGPYADRHGEDGLLFYKYRGADPDHRDNRGLREVMRRRLPIAYFFGIVPGRYLAVWPVFIVGDDRAGLDFTVAVDDANHVDLVGGQPAVFEDAMPRREYVTARVRRRLHQRTFRERVLEAYRRECSFCHFRHEELLDAAHIAADATPEGEPRVSNGLALCRLHHAAFDRHFVGLRPDLTLDVRPDLLAEEDGPTLVHGIQALHGQRIALPRSLSQRPDLLLVEARYAEFELHAEKVS